jgi:hypothetical protein
MGYLTRCNSLTVKADFSSQGVKQLASPRATGRALRATDLPSAVRSVCRRRDSSEAGLCLSPTSQEYQAAVRAEAD